MDKNTFSASNIQFARMQGMKVAYQIINIHGKEIKLIGAISNSSPDLVEFNTLRPSKLNPHNQPFVMQEINEFLNDSRKLCETLSQYPEINEQSFKKSLCSVIDSHISNFGRIIDTDLYAQIDKAIIIMFKLWWVFLNNQLDKQELSEYWVNFKNTLFNKFQNSIYITKYEFSSLHGPQASLVKLTDLNQ